MLCLHCRSTVDSVVVFKYNGAHYIIFTEAVASDRVGPSYRVKVRGGAGLR